jgi:hypothetical protein
MRAGRAAAHSTLRPVPTLWKYALGVLVACLIASMVIAVVKLSTTPEQVFDPNLQGWRGLELPR